MFPPPLKTPVAVADDLQRLHGHHSVAAAEGISGARHELQSGAALADESNRERRNGRNRK